MSVKPTMHALDIKVTCAMQEAVTPLSTAGYES